MDNEHQAKLEKWGLAPLEAQVYLALVRSAQSVGASAIATAAGIPRPSVYPLLKSLVERGLIENGEGYGSRFAAHPPEEALPRLIAAEKENLLERERLTADLVDELRSAAEMTQRKGADSKLIEIIRDPRVANERVQKLQAETEREVDVLVKPPMILQSKKTKGNPAQSKSLRRGIRHRAIYESTVLEHENIAPHLKSWIESGEQPGSGMARNGRSASRRPRPPAGFLGKWHGSHLSGKSYSSVGSAAIRQMRRTRRYMT